jgi:hypothetical protein
MDRHDRPYKCHERSCATTTGFAYSGGPLRHQREVHKMHGSQKRPPLFCPYPQCKSNPDLTCTRHGTKTSIGHATTETHQGVDYPVTLCSITHVDYHMYNESTERSKPLLHLPFCRRSSSLYPPLPLPTQVCHSVFSLVPLSSLWLLSPYSPFKALSSRPMLLPHTVLPRSSQSLASSAPPTPLSTLPLPSPSANTPPLRKTSP